MRQEKIISHRVAVLLTGCVMLASSLAGARAARAASAGTVAYDTLEVGASFATDTSRNEYHGFWDAGTGLDFYLLTPFHVGDLRAGCRYLSNYSRLEGVPNFRSAYVYTGWSYGVLLPWGLRIDPGFSFGVNVLRFDDEQIPGQEYESEISGELSLRMSRRIFHEWRLNLTGSSFVMLTQRRIDLSFVSAGISRSFSMPGWLRGFLE